MMQTKRFTRRVEDFDCEHCAQKVTGDGFTNHCPKCLWSKHVDILPGDRREECRGLMKPIGIEKEGDGYKIVHECSRCKKVVRVKTDKLDEFDQILHIAKGE